MLQPHYQELIVKLRAEQKRKERRGFLVILLVVIAILAFSSCRSDERKAEIAENQALVGESIVVRNDTLKIYRYNVMHDEFILENGMLASRMMVVTLKVR